MEYSSNILAEVRPYHSTETTMVKVVNDQLLAYPQGSVSLLVFEIIDHNILLDRLENIVGVEGEAHSWCRSSGPLLCQQHIVVCFSKGS